MQLEREELVKRVFPRLRKMCEERGVTWGEVDLRWGIPDERRAEGAVLPICLEEIRRCRPYFIGILGERYGWVPEDIPRELIEKEPWLAGHLEHSVTELEILHGVIRNPEMAGQAFFYFRDPEYVHLLPDDARGNFTEVPTLEEVGRLGPEEARRQLEDRRRKLSLLKDRIRASRMPVRENYRDPEDLGRLVFKDLSVVIDRLYPKDEKISPLDREASEHGAFARSRAGVYIGRREYFDRLDSHVFRDGPPLTVLGKSGSGKSALLANWALKYQEEHPKEQILLHFIGSSPASTGWSAMVKRILEEFQRRFGFDQKIPDKPDALRLAFANALHMVAARGRVILVLDGLNQLEDRNGAPDLVWLPLEIPANVRMVLSTLPGRPLEDLKHRGWPTFAVEPLASDERQKLIREYLAHYAKTLSPERAERISQSPQSSNPLFLRALLEELRVFGVHEHLDDRIAHYLAADSIPHLYELILARYEEDYERERPGLVRDAMTLIWAARRGLSEAELLDLMGAGGEPLPQAYWSPLFIATEESLVVRSGLVGFFHDYLREAVERRYLPSEHDRQGAHRRLADYFIRLELSLRKIDELPWHLSTAREWQRLYDLLADMKFFSAAWEADRDEVKQYWAEIEERSQFRKAEAYSKVIENPGLHAENDDLFFLWNLLNSSGCVGEAFELSKTFVELLKGNVDRKKYQIWLGMLASNIQNYGDLDGAKSLFKEKEQICRELGDKDELQSSLFCQAGILSTRGDMDGALALYKESEHICRELGEKDGLQASLNNQATILQIRGDLDGAMALFKESERICRELGNKTGLPGPLDNQGTILKVRGDLDGAMVLYNESERICRVLGDKAQLAAPLINQAAILYTRGDLDGAMVLYKESERIYRELGKKDGLPCPLNNQGGILSARGDLDGALALYKESEHICRDLGVKDDLEVSLNQQAAILYTQGDLDGAMALFKESERICRELGEKDGLQASLTNQATILQIRGDFDGAMALFKESERICRELGNKDGLQVSLGNQATILKDQGDLEGAMALFKESERICRELGNKDGLQVSLGNQAAIFYARGDMDGALALHEDEERICRELGIKKGLAIS